MSTTHAHGHLFQSPVVVSSSYGRQLRWLAAGLALGFLVPFLLADRLGVERDLYYLLYAVFVGVFFAAWAWSTGQPVGAMIRRHLRLTVGLGLAAAAVLAFMVIRVDSATARPGGVRLAAEVVWRGVVYGAADGLLLSAFPVLAVFAAFGSNAARPLRSKLGIGLLALVASLTMTASYHLGYQDFRSGKVRSPLAGDVVWSMPTLLTLNPVGAPIAHIGLHTVAVLHSYETDTFLPPHSSK